MKNQTEILTLVAPQWIVAHVRLTVSLVRFNGFPISSNFCHLLITYANSLDPDQDRQQVRIACALFGYLLMQLVLKAA